MKKENEALSEIESALDAMLHGNVADNLPPIDPDAYPEHLRTIAEKLGSLQKSLGEISSFSRNMADGNMDAEPPPRSNYLAGPLKEIQSQHASFYWSMQQLMQGNMVSKLYYPGALFEQYNSLIEKVSKTFSNDGEELPQWGSSVTSWRYHQILSAINHLHIMILEVDANGEILFANPPAREALGEFSALPYDQADPDGILLEYLCTFTKSHESSESAAKKKPVFNELYDTRTRTWYKITSDRIALTDGTTGMLHMIDDISERKHHEKQLNQSVQIDSLSAAYTRKAGFQKLEEAIDQRQCQHSCAAFVDIDRLKEINDKFGHTEGDFAIKSIAEILLSGVRKTDSVVRYGGDEFLILFLNCTKEIAQKAIDRMYLKLDQTNAGSKKPYTLSFSFGLAEITEDMEKASDLIALIDKKMYVHKMQRKNTRDHRDTK